MQHVIPAAMLAILFCLLLPIGASSKARASVKAWQVKQTNAWGRYTIHTTNNAIRIDGSSGGVLVARAPQWQVVVFHLREARICKIPYVHWKEKVPTSHRLTDTGRKPQLVSIAGLPAFKYTFAVNDFQDSDAGTNNLYRSKLTKDLILRRTFAVAKDESRLPIQVREIWRNFLELKTLGSIPLEIYELSGGKNAYKLQTQSQKFVFVDPSMFSSPGGLKELDSPFLVFFGGKQVEDMAHIIMLE